VSSWTTPADIGARARRRWTDGSLPAAYLAGEPCPPLDLPVHGPNPREIGNDLAAVRRWRDALVAGARGGAAYALTERAVGGRVIGRLTVPDRVAVVTYEQWWRLLGVGGQVRTLEEVVAETERAHEPLLPWVGRRPHTAIELAAAWPRLLAAVDWLVAESGRGRYLRQVTASGVDTKFIEQHAKVLGAWLDLLIPGAAAGRRSTAIGFAGRYGFVEPERLVRMRVAPDVGHWPPGVAEVGLPREQSAGLEMRPEAVLVVENQVTYLSVPIPAHGVVVWGHGFDAGLLGRLPWLAGAARVRYWGDLDTHGFAILSQLRSQVPGVESVLMDQPTLLAHRDRWVSEGRPTRADLGWLDARERGLYEELVEDVHGPAVRLEQERVDWAWALSALA
jgi:hypothetical protein